MPMRAARMQPPTAGRTGADICKPAGTLPSRHPPPDAAGPAGIFLQSDDFAQEKADEPPRDDALAAGKVRIRGWLPGGGIARCDVRAAIDQQPEELRGPGRAAVMARQDPAQIGRAHV